VRTPIGTGAGQARQRGRRLLRTLALIPVLMLAAYLGIAGYTADRLSHPARQTLVDNPARYGLTYTDVTFASAVDHIRLSGWLVGGPAAGPSSCCTAATRRAIATRRF
jgi:hypothetical protein